uniref:Uncharacterized protein n=1 Tax=Nelumbo nucifera TaxID=4432 RepID=A0A822XVD1_NELNU|nr:TPA_asm: hypothetical protein HUJ06_024379 [Nelumbo nucifera]
MFHKGNHESNVKAMRIFSNAVSQWSTFMVVCKLPLNRNISTNFPVLVALENETFLDEHYMA